MSRPADSWPHLGAVLARVLALPPPAWVSADTLACAGLLLRGLARDARVAVVGRSTREAPGVLGVARSVYLTALSGWMREGD